MLWADAETCSYRWHRLRKCSGRRRDGADGLEDEVQYLSECRSGLLKIGMYLQENVLRMGDRVRTLKDGIA